MKSRKRLTDEKALFLGLELKTHDKDRDTARYRLSSKQLELLQDNFYYPIQPNNREFVKTTVKLDKNERVVSSVEKLQSEPVEIPDNFEVIKISTSKTTGQQWIQYAPKKADIDLKVDEIDFEAIVKKHITPYTFKPAKQETGNYLFDRLVFTDVHIGMETNQNGHGLYGGLWDAEEINKRVVLMVAHILKNKTANTLIIDELGDFEDGWDGETVRRGHSLPQNMDNETAFDVGLDFKIHLIDALAPHYTKIICNNICNDNHAGAFGYVVNKAFKTFVEYKYTHVIVNNIRKFIDHYVINKNCFILTHGKDGKHLKFGFKPILDPKQIEKIEGYIKEHKLYNYIIEFSKGDSHQKIFDESTSDTFNYYNYPAFSPSSEWIQTNFAKGISGFEFFNFKNNGNKRHNPYRFEWNANRTEETKNYNLDY